MPMSSTTSPESGISGDAPPHVVEDFLGVLQLMSDGTVKRTPVPLVLGDASVTSATGPVQSKDVVYDEVHNLGARIYVPSAAAASTEKLPVIVYFHVGAFLSGSFAKPDTHDTCLRLATELPSVVLSADYLLAPEHRLPAALDAAVSFFSWLRAQAATAADQWLAAADFGRVFISGESSGGNIAHQLAMRIGSGKLESDPVRIAGYILLYPYFGGEERTASEAACPADVFLTLALYDQVWRLALPVGATRDHPAANPFGPDSPALEGSLELPPVLVTIGDRDMLLDRIRDYVARLKAVGARVELLELAGQGHIVSREAADEAFRAVRQFVHGGTAAPPS